MNPGASIERALCAIADKLAGTGAGWIVGGSAGLMLRGIPLLSPPRDLDLYADLPDAAVIHEALAAAAVDGPTRSTTPIYESVLSHYRSDGGVSIELVGGFVVSARGCRYEVGVRERLLPHADKLHVSPCSAAVALVPLAHELWFNWLRGREDRVSMIAAAMRDEPERHLPAYRALKAAGSFDSRAVRAVDAIVGESADELEGRGI